MIIAILKQFEFHRMFSGENKILLNMLRASTECSVVQDPWSNKYEFAMTAAQTYNTCVGSQRGHQFISILPLDFIKEPSADHLCTINPWSLASTRKARL